ncbi:hypothetical protein PG985_014964 [Apiospora marii]|uniref:Major facilitator superfamily (MFS) profile domain-containing protein n=1 Tax=Apiospora marii TaxID=335849 RepID=A0ABR1RIR9_9PEZI
MPAIANHVKYQVFTSVVGVRGTAITTLLDFPLAHARHAEMSAPVYQETWVDQRGRAESLRGRPGSHKLRRSHRAWGVVLGGFINYFATFGLLNTFGLFQTFYQTELLQGTSSSTISWIGSIQLFLLFIGGMAVGPAFDKVGARRLTVPGTLLYVLAFMFTSLGTRFYQILLAQGFLYGIASALLFYPTISVINVWFDKNRGLALGIVVSGSSIGGIVWPIVIEKLIGRVGFGWAMRVVGFICLGVLSASSALVVESPKPPRRRDDSQAVQDDKQTVGAKAELLNTGYLLLAAGFTFAYLGMFIPFYYIPLYGIDHGFSFDMATNLLSILNAGSFVGRLASGFLSDMFGVGTLLFCLLVMKTKPTIIAFSVLYGLFTGGLISLQSGCVARITANVDIIGLKIGVLMAICSVGALAGGPVGGALVAHDNGGYTAMIIFSGATLLFAGVLFIMARFALASELRVQSPGLRH